MAATLGSPAMSPSIRILRGVAKQLGGMLFSPGNVIYYYPLPTLRCCLSELCGFNSETNARRAQPCCEFNMIGETYCISAMTNAAVASIAGAELYEC